MIAEFLIMAFLLMFFLGGLEASKEISGLVIAIALSITTATPFVFWFIVYLIFMVVLRIELKGGMAG